MSVLSASLRSALERAVGEGRVAAEAAAIGALSRLGATEQTPPTYLTVEELGLRQGLLARAVQLGDPRSGGSVDVAVPLLVGEVAYEQWHRLLFARFLAENGLLMHPDFGAPVSLDECEELAASLEEPDGWSVAGRFASQILPGIFRLDDPAVLVRLAPEDRLALEKIVTGLPAEVFTADDALGWVYQYWQSTQKKLVNDSGRKIGGADISPVTQLFTEDYMVRFLLENSLGAWWAARFPHSPLISEWNYLRFDENGAPAAGVFDGWPATVTTLTVMDPCCGSGHFLVAAFGMLWRMRAEAEKLSPADAQDAVLRDNLFGLELDPRCTQIAMFNLALEAWKQGGYRKLPVPNIACSGIPAKAPLEEWTVLANGDVRLEAALTRLHELFKDADTLGSLIDPRRAAEQDDLFSVDWDRVAPFLEEALAREQKGPASNVFGRAAAGVAVAAEFLTRTYTLVATNPPYLGRGSQEAVLRDYCLTKYPLSEADLATVFAERVQHLANSSALVLPHNWLFTSAYTELREDWLSRLRWLGIVRLGPGAFTGISGEVVQGLLWLSRNDSPPNTYFEIDSQAMSGPSAKARAIRSGSATVVEQLPQLSNPKFVVMVAGQRVGTTIQDVADVRAGLSTGDAPVFVRYFWEPRPGSFGTVWNQLRSAPGKGTDEGAQLAILWESERGRLAAWADSVSHLNHAAQGWRRGKPLWSRRGVAVKMMGELNVAIYSGEPFDASVAVIVPKKDSDLPALWAFAQSGMMQKAIRQFHRKLSIESGTLLSTPFDPHRWRQVGAELFPDGLPQPHSNDPTQWSFTGVTSDSTEQLQVAVARLVGFSWPSQEPDAIDSLVDTDGIVCLPPIAGEDSAGQRLRGILAAANGANWSTAMLDDLIAGAGGSSGDLDGWLRDVFFRQHANMFHNRPFIWHIWDGRADGFSALVNYHQLDRKTLQKLTYTTLGWWLQKQKDDAATEVPGASARLAAASQLKSKLELILEGEPPYDLYIRWKSLAEQPIGWDPDLDDGIRVNIRPFVKAGILRTKFTIKWNKDRGTNLDGSERLNDLHYTTQQKLQARGGTG